MNTNTIAAGLCQCGCGQPAPVAKRNDATHNMVKGQPCRYIKGHQPNQWPRKRSTVQKAVVQEVYVGGFLDSVEPDPGPAYGYYLKRPVLLADARVLTVFDHLWRIYGPTSAVRYARIMSTPRSADPRYEARASTENQHGYN